MYLTNDEKIRNEIDNIGQLAADMRFKVDCDNLDIYTELSSVENWVASIRRRLRKKENITLEICYEKMKKYIFELASEEELKEHYDWYKVAIGDKEDLLNTMFESYANSYDDKELLERCKDLLK
jgi:hypothetical protein